MDLFLCDDVDVLLVNKTFPKVTSLSRHIDDSSHMSVMNDGDECDDGSKHRTTSHHTRTYNKDTAVLTWEVWRFDGNGCDAKACYTCQEPFKQCLSERK